MESLGVDLPDLTRDGFRAPLTVVPTKIRSASCERRVSSVRPDMAHRRPWEDRWDHATLLWTEDPLAAAIARVQAEAPEKVVRLPGNPTVELLAREAWQAISQGLPSGIVLKRAVIRETPTCSAEIGRDRA